MLMLFGAVLSSLSLETRLVHDFLDHCWNEFLIGGKWIHIDSTLDYPISFDNPIIMNRIGKKITILVWHFQIPLLRMSLFPIFKNGIIYYKEDQSKSSI
jgi:hypothetical protein